MSVSEFYTGPEQRLGIPRRTRLEFRLIARIMKFEFNLFYALTLHGLAGIKIEFNDLKSNSNFSKFVLQPHPSTDETPNLEIRSKEVSIGSLRLNVAVIASSFCVCLTLLSYAAVRRSMTKYHAAQPQARSV